MLGLDLNREKLVCFVVVKWGQQQKQHWQASKQPEWPRFLA
jgi:hypothetical protein